MRRSKWMREERATKRCAARPSRRRSPISAMRSPWRTRQRGAGAAAGGCSCLFEAASQAATTDYGQAMMWSKGFAADETKTAFARAAELAARTGDFSERFAAYHGQWTLEIVRGELRSARELASTFLREAEDAGRVVETSVAHRGLALIGYFSDVIFSTRRTHC